MKNNLGMFCGLPRLGGGVTLSALFAIVAACAFPVSNAQAGLVAEWQFDSSYNGGVNSGLIANPTVFNPEYGWQSGSATLTAASSAGQGFINNYQGTDLNAYQSTANNGDLKAKGGGTVGTITLEVGGVGLSDFVLTYATRNVVATTQTWTYSTDGVHYYSLGILVDGVSGNTATPVSGSVWTLFTVDFSGVTALDGASTVYFQDSFTTLSGSNDTISFDNMAISVPEPVNYALAGFGLIFIGGSAGYTLRRKLCPAKAA